MLMTGRNFWLKSRGINTGRPTMSTASMGDTMSSDTSICLLTVRLVVSTLW